MNILFAIKSMNSVGGGAERVLADVSRGLSHRVHSISILTYDAPYGDSFYPLHESIKRIDLGIGMPDNHSTLLETIRRVVALRRVVLEVKPDIVIGFMHSMFVPLGIALAFTKYPVIASEHIGIEHYRTRPVEHFLLQLTPYLTKNIIAISEKVRDGFNDHLRKHMVVIPNPVCIPKNNRVESLKRNFGRKIILSVGRLASQKDHKTLLKAYALLSDDFLEWDLKIIGDGELRPQLEAQIKTLGLQKRVQIVSVTQNIEEEYLKAQIFVMPSLYESFGLATAEALAHGLPAVGFADCAGTNELIKHGQNGILVRGDQRDTVLADGIRRLMRSPELREQLGRSGVNSLSHFSIDKICDKWEKLLQI